MAVKYNITPKLDLAPVILSTLNEHGMSIVACGDQLQLVGAQKQVIAQDCVGNKTIGKALQGDDFELSDLNAAVYKLVHVNVIEQAGSPESTGPTSPSSPTPEFRIGSRSADQSAFGGEPCKLCQADRLYQPVFGTSSGSRYYVVGLGQTPDGGRVVLAARALSGKVSVRLEGDVLEQEPVPFNVHSVGCMSFHHKDSDSANHNGWQYYASAHLETGGNSPFAITRTLSGLIGALSVYAEVVWTTPLPSGDLLTQQTP